MNSMVFIVLLVTANTSCLITEAKAQAQESLTSIETK